MNRDKRWISVLGGLFFSVALSLAQTPVSVAHVDRNEAKERALTS